jgi:hypothetical protein
MFVGVYNYHWALKAKEAHESIWNPPKFKIKNFIFLKEGNVNLFPYTLWMYVEGVELYFHSFLTSVLDAGQWWDLLPDRIAPPLRENVRCIHWTGGSMDPRANLSSLERTEYSSPAGIEPWFLSRPVRCLVTVSTKLSRFRKRKTSSVLFVNFRTLLF